MVVISQERNETVQLERVQSLYIVISSPLNVSPLSVYVYLIKKTSVPVFYRKYADAYELKQECATTSALITPTRTSTYILFCDNTTTPITPL